MSINVSSQGNLDDVVGDEDSSSGGVRGEGGEVLEGRVDGERGGEGDALGDTLDLVVETCGTSLEECVTASEASGEGEGGREDQGRAWEGEGRRRGGTVSACWERQADRRRSSAHPSAQSSSTLAPATALTIMAWRALETTVAAALYMSSTAGATEDERVSDRTRGRDGQGLTRSLNDGGRRGLGVLLVCCGCHAKSREVWWGTGHGSTTRDFPTSQAQKGSDEELATSRRRRGTRSIGRSGRRCITLAGGWTALRDSIALSTINSNDSVLYHQISSSIPSHSKTGGTTLV